jgi:hypothetical protein
LTDGQCLRGAPVTTSTNQQDCKTKKFNKDADQTTSIIKQVHALAELDEMPAGLKITN